MKRIKSQDVMLSMFGMLPLLAIAGGTYSPGTVQVNSLGSVTVLTGSYNVRYNPAVTSGYVTVSESSYSGVTIAGKDSSTGQFFSCNVAKTDALFSLAEKALTAGGNGGWIWAQMPANGTQCQAIQFYKSSMSLD